MREWLQRLLARPWEAVLLLAAMVWLGGRAVPFMVLGQGLVALLVLRHGPLLGLKIWVVAVLAAGAVIAVLGAPVLKHLLPQVMLSGLVVLGAAALRLGLSLSTTLMVTVAGLFLYVMVVRWSLGDVDHFWLETLLRFADSQALGEQGPELKALITRTAPWMGTTLAALLFLGAFAALSLARYWQGVLSDRPLFGPEFKRLRLGPRLSALGLVVFLLAWQGVVWREFLVIAGGLGGLVGLAILHAQAAASGWGLWLPALVYLGVLLLPPLLLPPLVVVGFVDGWLDFRNLRRAKPLE